MAGAVKEGGRSPGYTTGITRESPLPATTKSRLNMQTSLWRFFVNQVVVVLEYSPGVENMKKNSNVGIQRWNPATITFIYLFDPVTEVRQLVVEEDASPLRVNPRPESAGSRDFRQAGGPTSKPRPQW